MENQAGFPSPFILGSFFALFRTQDPLSPLQSSPSVPQTELIPFGLLNLAIPLSLLDDGNHCILLFCIGSPRLSAGFLQFLEVRGGLTYPYISGA